MTCKKWLLAVAMVAVVILVVFNFRHTRMLVYLPGIILFGISDGGAAEEAAQLVQFIVSHVTFAKESVSVPGRSPVFSNPGARGLLGTFPHQVIVYTVLDTAEQDRIIALVETYKKTLDIRSVEVRFFEEENWSTWISPDGLRSGDSRGTEEFLRVVTVE